VKASLIAQSPPVEGLLCFLFFYDIIVENIQLNSPNMSSPLCNLCDQEITSGLTVPQGTPHHKQCWNEYKQDLEAELSKVIHKDELLAKIAEL